MKFIKCGENIDVFQGVKLRFQGNRQIIPNHTHARDYFNQPIEVEPPFFPASGRLSFAARPRPITDH